MLSPGQAFHVYPTQQQTFVPYDRGTPLACDAIEFDTTGCFNTSLYGWVAPSDCIVEFYGEILWQTGYPDGAYTCAVIAKNPQVPTASSWNAYRRDGGRARYRDALATWLGIGS